MKQYVLKFGIVGLISITFLTQGSIAAPPQFKTSTILLPDLQRSKELQANLTYPNELSSFATQIHRLTLKAAHLSQKTLGVSFRDSFDIIFDPRPASHNGMATVIPRNRIYIFLSPPDLDSSIGLSTDYLLETLIHEMTHMLYLQQRSGIFSFLDSFVGNLARPLSLWPRWIHEGLAVYSEGSAGGRPHSGIIQEQLRLYAEYYQRNKKHPFTNSDLDGSFDWSNVARGNYPYHFGYLLLKHWLEKNPKNPSLASVLNDFSNSPGLSFRQILREQGYDLDEAFSNARMEWAATPLPSDADWNHGKILQEAQSLRGPFRSDYAISWIEFNKETDSLQLMSRSFSQNKIISQSWPSWKGSVQKYLKLSAQQSLVLFQKTPRHITDFPRSTAVLTDAQGKEHCQFSVAENVRDVHISNDFLTWIESDQSGLTFLKQARTTTNCNIDQSRILFQTQTPFERLSGIYTDDKNWLASVSPERNAYQEKILWNGEQISGPFSLGYPQPLPSSFCPSALRCFVAQGYSKQHWSPVVAIQNAHKNWEFFEISVRTGTSKVTYDPIHFEFVATEQFWEMDQLKSLKIKRKDLSPLNAPNIRESSHYTSAQTMTAADNKSYDALRSIWPQFWIPSILFTSDGLQIGGQTFFGDNLNHWQGTLTAGHNTFTKRPLGIISLQKNFENASFERIGAFALYLPQKIFNITQNRASTGISSYWSKRNSSGHQFGITPSLNYLWAEEAIKLNEYNYISPSLTLSYATPRGKNYDNSLLRLAETTSGLFFKHHTSYLKSFDNFQRFDVHFPLFKTGLLISVEHGKTSRKNYPATYIEWGGVQNLSNPRQAFLSRGFAPNLFIANEAMRFGTEWGVSLSHLSLGLDWNRLRARQLDFRLITETVSWTSFYSDSKFKMGRQYFTTLGGNFEILGSALHYLGYRATLGYFRGFGKYGENRIAFGLESLLDL